MKKRKIIFLSFLSGILLSLSFPNFSLGYLAWIALVPLLEAVRLARSHREALLAGLVAGVVHFGISLFWLTHVIFFGWIFVACLQTLFLILFCWLVNIVRKIRSAPVRILWIALAWTTSEWLRAEFPVFGLGWNLLAYSQAEFAVVRQAASAISAFGLGFLIAAFNACASEFFFSAKKIGKGKRLFAILSKPSLIRKMRSLFHYPLAGVLILFALVLYGRFQIGSPVEKEGTVRISLIQGNIPQDIKWDPTVREEIIEIYEKLSELASFERPDLILWPEAAFPGYFNLGMKADGIDAFAKKIGVPVLIGSPHLEKDGTAYNSAYLLDSDGQVFERYDKQYLVPFGEYVPLKFLFGWLEPLAYSLGVSDFSAGRLATVFRLPSSRFSFSVLVCFEDIFANIAREFVDRGAHFLTVITNDAWFDRSAAPYQHLQASVFRAIENGVPVVRAANTGVSAFITEKGHVHSRVQNEQGDDIFVTGRETADIPIRENVTLFRKGGWMFPYVGALIFILMFFWKGLVLDRANDPRRKIKASKKSQKGEIIR